MSSNLFKTWVVHSEIKYYQHFVALWSSFNAWYRQHLGRSTDRAAINEIKSWNDSEPLVQAFFKIAKRKDPLKEPIRKELQNHPFTENKRTIGYFDYIQENVVSRFIKQIWTNPTIHNNSSIWIGDSSDDPGIPRTSQVGTVYFSSKLYIELYSHLAEVEASEEGMPFPVISVQTALKELGINSYHSYFYADPSLPSTPTTPQARSLKNYHNPVIEKILRAQANTPQGLFADVVEMLYVVRNACVHGVFQDPVTSENNILLQAAFEFLSAFCQEFLNIESKILHF